LKGIHLFAKRDLLLLQVLDLLPEVGDLVLDVLLAPEGRLELGFVPFVLEVLVLEGAGPPGA